MVSTGNRTVCSSTAGEPHAPACRIRGFFRITGLIPEGYLPASDEAQRQRLGFKYDPDEIPGDVDVTGGHVTLLHSWKSSIHQIAGLDRERDILRFTGPLRSDWTIGRWDPQQRYWIEAVADACDAPGEWYFDRVTRVIHYRPLPGELPEQVTAVAARLKQLLVLKGDPAAGQFIEHLRFEGITFTHADWRFEAEKGGNEVYQAHPSEGAAILWDGARQCRFTENRLEHVGRFALWLRHANRHCRIERNLIYDVGAGGVRLGVTKMPADAAMVTTHTLVENNLVSGYGRIFHGAHGVLITHSADNHIRRNEICDGHYSGMQVGFNWGYEETHTLRNKIIGNHIHHVGQGVLSDLGGIYTLGKQGGAVVHNNLIHDVFAYERHPIGWGIYLDQASHGVTVSSNLTFNTSSGGIMNTGLPGNQIHDNIVTRSQQALVWRFQPGELSPPTSFERNVLVATQGLFFNHDGGSADRTSLWDYNLYWRTDGRPILLYGGTLERWQRQGHDRHGLVADPLFMDADGLDFRLAEDSPAVVELGVQPIDLASVGLYGDPAWQALAARMRQQLAQELPPPRPNSQPDGSVVLDFEDVDVGDRPSIGRVHSAMDGSAGKVIVSAERKAVGEKSLQLVDSTQVKRSWNPKIDFSPGIDGSIEVSAWVWLSAQAELTIEWRKYTSQYLEGPKLTLNAGGAFSIGERLVETPMEKWFHVTMSAEVGPDEKAMWRLTLKDRDGRTFYEEDLTSQNQLSLLDYVGFMSTGQQQAEIFLDQISIGEAEPVSAE